MSKVQVTFTFVPEPDEADEGDPTGLTEAGYNALQDQLMQLGAEDSHVEKVIERGGPAAEHLPRKAKS
jgi:hypothetical protein